MFFPYSDWENDPDNCIYLGSEVNPRTRRKYDYWLIRTPSHTKDIEGEWSPTSRHGELDYEYGSCPLCICWYDFTHISAEGDFLFGMSRARQLGLYYLATNKKPLLEKEL